MTVSPKLASMAAFFVALSASAAIAAPPPPTPLDVATFQESGAYVFRAGEASLPLYTFDRDASGKSNCAGPCAAAWPPLAVTPGSAPVGEWSVIKRDDAKLQWAWRGRPVYTYAKDMPEKPTGDGLGGVWRLIPTLPAD